MPVFSHGFGIVCACAWSFFIVFRMLLLFTAVVLGHHRHCRRCRHHHCCSRRRHCCHHHHHFQPTTTANPPTPMTSPSIDHKIPFHFMVILQNSRSHNIMFFLIFPTPQPKILSKLASFWSQHPANQTSSLIPNHQSKYKYPDYLVQVE